MNLYSHIIQNQNELDGLYQGISQNTILLKPLTTPYTNLMAYLLLNVTHKIKQNSLAIILSIVLKNPVTV